MPPNRMVYAMLWLVLCMAGAFGGIANAAHLVGLVAGVGIGGRQAFWKYLRQRT